MSIGVYAASLGMDGVGVYCSWEMLGRPSTITCTTFLAKGPCLPQGSWWCVLRVRSSCLLTEGSRLVYQLENLWVQLASQSFLVGQPQLYCCAKSLFNPPFLYSLPPLFHELGPVSPPHSPSSILLPYPLFGLCPSHQLLALHSFFVPSHLFFRLSS